MDKREIRAVAQDLAAAVVLFGVMAAGIVLVERGAWLGMFILGALFGVMVAAMVALWMCWPR
ncbi:hypothetical protein ACFY4C_41935 [Actinomadura viridis]|uniref:hypothetical protein n=1 Tax=Actinomadura viridis TaxID=58110 RepID=UPI0036739038